MNFKIGDSVRIKTLANLTEQYGVYGDGDIRCSPYFKPSHKIYCGRSGTISSITDNGIALTEAAFDNNVFSSKVLERIVELTLVKGHILICDFDAYSINININKGYTIREFHDNKCIMVYSPINTL